MTNEYLLLKDQLLRLVSDAPEQRLRPFEAIRTLAAALHVSLWTVRQAIEDLVDEGRLVFTYRDPTSFVELGEAFAPLHPVC